MAQRLTMLALTNITKSFGECTLFSDVTFSIGACERLALLGPNGAGKTTLLEIIAGETSPDMGIITRRKGLTVGYLRQEIPPASPQLLLAAVVAAVSTTSTIQHRIEFLQEELSDDACESKVPLLRELGELQHRFESSGGYDTEHEAKAILGGLGFKEADFGCPLSTLSGGTLMRAELAKLLLLNPDLLLLDEPTNHLDLETQLWFESFLRDYRGAVLLTSHDRAFLNRVVERVLVLENGGLTSYRGNYDAYVAIHAEVRAATSATARRQASKIEQQGRFITRFRAKSTKAHQVQSRIKALSRIERVQVPRQTKKIHFSFPAPPHSGHEVISLTHICKAYGEKEIYSDLNLTLYRGDKAALVGPNGAGKTTLLKIMAGALPFEGGTRRLGHNVATSYYAQHQLELLESRNTVLSELMRVANNKPEAYLRHILGGFLFAGDNIEKPIAVLSGGEKARLALAKMLIQSANLILMDEPTNHLDITSREILADALESYQGTLCFITHDRTLIREVATQIIEVKSGKLILFPGNYDSYLYHQSFVEEPAPITFSHGKLPSSSRKRVAEGTLRSDYYRQNAPLKKRAADIEAEMSRLEAEQHDLELRFGCPAAYQDAKQIVAHLERHRALKDMIVALTTEWEQLLLKIDALKTKFKADLGRD
ncbi:MAG: ABC-F family ATP-binding cassette domain-containing protein [Dehalococcoidia bacterium]|nr:ABC-F family ATP-binding cassette domain-containing protein [Dehalococcoidia bacterium]